MSLIADALKAAQREKAKRAAANERPSDTTLFPLKRPTTSRNAPSQRWRRYGVAGAAAVAIVAAGWLLSYLLRAKPGEPDARSTLAMDTSALVDTASNGVPYIIDEAEAEGESFDEPAYNYSPPRRRAAVAEQMRSVRPPDEPRTEATSPSTAPLAAAPPVQNRSGALRIEVEQPIQVAANPLIAQALAAQNRGDWAAARSFYERVLASGVATADIYNNLGTVYKNLGDLQKAEQSYQSAVVVNPSFAPGWSNLGVVLYTLGRKREATAAYQEALRLDPTNAATKVNLAILFNESGVHAEARRLLEESLAADPLSAEAHYTLAQVLEASGDRAGAVRYYESFLRASGGRFATLEAQVRRHLLTLR